MDIIIIKELVKRSSAAKQSQSAMYKNRATQKAKVISKRLKSYKITYYRRIDNKKVSLTGPASLWQYKGIQIHCTCTVQQIRQKTKVKQLLKGYKISH